ncbi:MAG: hypothetical protein NVS2B9_07430 [Myxococcales bacterium]
MNAAAAFAVPLAALLAAGCQSYVAVPVQPATLIAVAQHRKVTVATKADILFVVDDSFSMTGKQQSLAAALANFTKDLDSLQPPVDYQVAVVSTSVQERFGACGPPGDPNAALQCSSDWGAPGFVCDRGSGCLRTFPERAGVLRAASGAPAVLRRRDSSADQFSFLLSRAVQVGTDGARQPQGLQAMQLVLDKPGNGLMRDGAKLVVAFFSDAEDCSDPAGRFSMLVRDSLGNTIDRCAQEAAGQGVPGGPSLQPVSSYVAALRALKNADGSPKEVQVASVVSLRNGTQDPGLCANPACDAACDTPAAAQQCAQRCSAAAQVAQCQADCLSECHTFCGGQVPGRRYVEAALSFSGIAANICSGDASGPLRRLAAVVGIPKQVVLAAPPQSPDLLRVRVARRGAIVDCLPGQGFDLIPTPDGTAVRFAGPCLLQPDDVWDIRYLANP